MDYPNGKLERIDNIVDVSLTQIPTADPLNSSLDAIRTNALAINVRGEIVGRYDTPDGVTHGYMLGEGVFTTIDFPEAAGFTVVTDIDPAGQMVGRYRGSDGKFYGFSLIDGVFTTDDHKDPNGNPDMG